MARIRIVDSWLRSPASPPTHQRAVMVVAEAWAEQKVLMRAFASSPDQMRPTIVLHGNLLAISPAGVDPHGAWGIHVEPPADGRAQELRAQLEVAARRLAGSKGNPPRLMDEVSSFDRKATNNWAPGTPPDVPHGPGHGPVSPHYYEPANAASGMPYAPLPGYGPPPAAPGYGPPAPVPGYGAAPPVPGYGPPPPMPGHGSSPGYGPPPPMPDHASSPGYGPPPPAPAFGPASMPPDHGPPPPAPGHGYAPPPPAAPGPWPAQPPAAVNQPRPVAMATRSLHSHGGRSSVGSTTARGYAPGDGAHVTGRSAVPASGNKSGLALLIGRTMPPGFHLTASERSVLDALDTAQRMTAREIARIAGTSDGASWMAALMAKLMDYGLDIVAPGEQMYGEPTYVLRR